MLQDAELSELPDPVGDADVTIALGLVRQDFLEDNKLVKLSAAWSFLIADPGRFYMRCNGYDFDISGGRSIVIDPHGLPAESSILVTYILGSAFGAIGMQRGLVPFHGAAVCIGGSAAIIAGFSGSGKSAILSALVMDGYKYLADDVSMVVLKDGTPFALPSYPQRKITEDDATEAGECLTDASYRKEEGRVKYAIRRPSEWLDEKLPVSCIVEIYPELRENYPQFRPEINRINGHASLNLLIRCVYRPRFASGVGAAPERLTQLLKIASRVKVYRLVRPREGYPIRETARVIIDHCFNENRRQEF